MRSCFLLFFLALSFFGSAQQLITGVVKDLKTNKPLAFANIITNTSLGTITNADGSFEIRNNSELRSFTVSYIGYRKEQISVVEGKQFYSVLLSENIERLSEVTLISGENPALEILRKTIASKNENNPEKKLKSYSFKAYNKLMVTANPDSISGSIDSVFIRKKGALEFKELDSSNYELKKQLSRSHLYLTEKVSNYTFTKEKGRRENILATRMAGFKEPIYEILSLQIQSFSFYQNTYTLFGTKYTNPIANNALKKYHYRILDTVKLHNRPAYMIYYFPKEKGETAGLEGVLYIDSKSFALQRGIAQLKAVVDVKAVQDFKYFKKENIWLPLKKEIKIKKGDGKDPASFFGGNVLISDTSTSKDSTLVNTKKKDESEVIYLTSKEQNFDIQLNIPLKLKNRGLEVQIDDNAHKQTTNFWEQYRTDSLTQRGEQTYAYLDSIVKEERIEKKINSARKILRGYIPLKYIDIDARNILKYNNHEGFRLGLGFITNADFSPIYRLNGHLVYGTKDGRFKYSLGGKTRLNKNTTTWLGINYTDDLIETGSTPFITDERTFSLFEPRLFNITLFHKSRSVSGFIEHDLTAKTHAKLEVKTSNITPTFNYSYLKDLESISHFDLTTATLGISWNPFNEYLLTRHGKQVSKSEYPQFSFQAIQSIPNVFNGDLSFTKFNLKARYEMGSLNKKSTTSFFVTAGLAFGDVPVTHLYNASPNQPFGNAVLKRFSIAGRDSFETMFFNEFFSDRIATFQVKHTFRPFKISRKFRPQLMLISRYAIGDINNPQRHLGINFNSLEKGYSESGFELNKLFKGFGLSTMYRHGTYHLPRFDDNISFKFTFYFSLGL